MPEVVVIGAGPVGLVLGIELRRLGIDVLILESRTEAGDASRAIGIHPPALTRLQPSGVTDLLLAEAFRIRRGEAHADGDLLGTVRFDRLHRRFPFVASLPQARTMAALETLAPTVRRGRRATRVDGSARDVRIRLEDAEDVVVPIVVVAGGAHGRELLYRPGAVRRHVETGDWAMADVPATGPDAAVVHLERGGVVESFPLPDGHRRFVARVAPTDDVTAALSDRVARAVGTDAAASIVEASRFSIHRAVAPSMRRGRVLAIGDTAHEVSPIGGQGMNLGFLDATTLAPLLADWATRGEAPDPELRRWERRRLASARTAARIAALNGALGAETSRFGHAVRRRLLRTTIGGPLSALAAHAYAMGLDRDA